MARFNSFLVLAILPLLFFSCNEEKKCSDEFTVSYQRMGDTFEALYKPLSGSLELNNLKQSMSNFLKDHDGVECKLGGSLIKPSVEVKAFQASLPKSQNKERFVFPKVIYGEDNRQDVASSSQKNQGFAASTMAQISPDEWDNNFNLTSKTLGEEFRLCPGERFENQLSVSRCSGFLVAPDVVVTAGHCMQSQSDCDQFRWVLDFKDDVRSLKSSNIFGCKEVLNQVLDDENSLDYAVVKLDRSIEGRRFFRTRTSGVVATGTPLVVIGHPSGISTKVSAGASVRSSNEPNYFVSNLDTFGGNSGSAVINVNSGVVEGVLVRGDEDYTIVDGPDGGRCRKVNVCANDGCNGEEVTKMTSVEGVPLLADPKKIRDGFYNDKDFPTSRDGLPIDYMAYSFGGFNLGGLKFLDRCGIHYYEDGDDSNWQDFFVGTCDKQNNIDEVILAFGNNFYF